MKIGNRNVAQAYMDGDMSGFKKLSGGSCREVFLHEPSDVVYKFDGSWGDQRGYGNNCEYRNAKALRLTAPDGWVTPRVYIPAVTMFTLNRGKALAMEHIDGEVAGHFGSDGALARWDLFNLGFEDMHGMNYMFLSGSRKSKLAVIDMGSPRYAKNPLNRADRRAVSSTRFAQRVTDHRDWHWRNVDKMPKEAGHPASCPCRCGAVAWYV